MWQIVHILLQLRHNSRVWAIFLPPRRGVLSSVRGMNGLPYYRRFPRDLIEGTVGMSFEVKAAYGLILDLIYIQHGRLPDDPRYIAGVLNCSTRKWNSIRRALIEDHGKLRVDGEYLVNGRASKEVEALDEYSKSQSDRRRGKGPKQAAENTSIAAQPEGEREIISELSQDKSEIKTPKNDPDPTKSSTYENPRKNLPDTYKEKVSDGSSLRSLPPPTLPVVVEASGPVGNHDGLELEPHPDDARAEILAAMGVGPDGNIGTTTPKIIGGQADMAEYRRWRDDLHLSHRQVVSVIGEVMATRTEADPPTAWKYFRKPMQRAAADLHQPTIEPAKGRSVAKHNADPNRHAARAERLAAKRSS